MRLCDSKQGLLRVAIENARAQEKQDQLERTELKMELVRERELRETLERQLSMEQKNRGASKFQQDKKKNCFSCGRHTMTRNFVLSVEFIHTGAARVLTPEL